MNLYTAVALPVFLLALQPQDLYGKDKEVILWAAPKPQPRVSFGHGIDLIVKGLGLNIDNIRFIKAPKATDYFKLANNKAAYAPSLIIAANNGIQSGRTLRPDAPATREQFALALYEAIQSTGQYPVNMMWLTVNDEASFSEATLSAVQTLVKFNVVTLEKGNFRPKSYITEGEAKKMVKNAASFIQSHKGNAGAENGHVPSVTFTSIPVNDKVNRIVLAGGTQPNSGYHLVITSIVFSAANEAIVHYKLTVPAPGSINLEVMTELTADTFISAAYKVILQADEKE